MAPTTRGGPNTHVNDTNPNNMTPESIQAMIDQALLRNATNGDGSHSSHGDNRRNVQTARPCFYADFMKCQPLNFKGAEGVVGLTRWIEKMESVFHISGCAVENQVKFATCTLAPNPTKVKIETRPRATHEVQLLTVTANHVLDMENTTVEEEQTQDGLSHKIPHVQNPTTVVAVPEPDPEKEVAAMGPQVNKRRRKRGNDGVDANAPPKVLMKDHVALRPAQSTLGGKFLAAIGLDVGSTLVTPATQETPSNAKSVNDPDPLSCAKTQPCPKQDVAQSSRKTALEIPTKNVTTVEAQDMFSVESPGSGKSTSVPSMVESPGVRLLKKAKAQIARRDQRIQVREEEIKKLDQEIKSLKTMETKVHGLRNQARNLETLLEVEVDMKKAVKAKNVGLAKELESLRAQFADLQVSNNQLYKQVSTLQTQVTGEERIKAAFEEFKKYKDNRVSSRCAEIDARLDALSIDFDEELYPHMLTAIAGRQWVIGHGLRLAIMKCAESTELRHVFANVVSAGIAKGMIEGLKHGIEHGKANLDLAAIEAYDPDADTKYVAALHALKDLKYPLVEQLEKLKDAPVDLIMTSLYLESDSGEDAP
ncbi:hypothetical protein Tco_1562271 [Tanacetum coccineum]